MSKRFVGLGQGILSEKGRLSTVNLLLKAACFVKKENHIFNLKTS